jgi:hypothetical protein
MPSTTVQKIENVTSKREGMDQEERLALVHRVIVPDEDYPKEYAILVTDRRLIFIRQERTRRPFVLRYELKIGTALVIDFEPKTLKDYQSTSLESLVANQENIGVPLESVVSFAMKADPLQYRRRDFMVRFIMKRQKAIFQVYNFELTYLEGGNQRKVLKFYAVPLGAYFKPRRQVQNRETVLREYASDIYSIFQTILPIENLSNSARRDSPA